MKDLIFKGVRYEMQFGGQDKGWYSTEIPFEMRCRHEMECIAVSDDDLHCWVKFQDGTWRFGLWMQYRVDSVTEVG